jgi:hypothetical protein
MLTKLAPALVVAIGFAAGVPSLACSLAAVDAQKIKEKMATAIADALGWEVERVSTDAITTPQQHSPLGLGADCSGLGAFHHTAGFRLEDRGCRYEGVAVLLGYWYTNPVAVHHTRECS